MRPRNKTGDSVNLEEAFFAKQNSHLLEGMRKKAEKEELIEDLRKVVGNEDRAFLERLIAMGIRPETVVALRLIPLVFVAWADGTVEARERDAILEAAQTHGVAADATTRAMLAEWLDHKPEPRLLALWKTYVAGIWNRFTPDEQWQMRQNLLGNARDVAEAAGGFLGLTSKISAAEQAVLDDLDGIVS